MVPSQRRTRHTRTNPKINVKRLRPASLGSMPRHATKMLYTPVTRTTSSSKTFLDYIYNTNYEFTVIYSSESEYNAKFEKVKAINRQVSALGRDSILNFCLQQVYNQYRVSTLEEGKLERSDAELFQNMTETYIYAQFGIAAADFYTKNITRDMINRGTEVVDRVKEALRNRLKTSSWLSSAAVNYALQKLDSMQIYVCSIGNTNSPYL